MNFILTAGAMIHVFSFFYFPTEVWMVEWVNVKQDLGVVKLILAALCKPSCQSAHFHSVVRPSENLHKRTLWIRTRALAMWGNALYSLMLLIRTSFSFSSALSN